MIAVWIVLGLVVVLALAGVAMYNGLIKLRNRVQEGWRQIDVELKRRHDLIPNLVETVKGYAGHERGTLEDVMTARSTAMAGGQTPAQAAQNEGMLSQALGRLIAVSEAYPQLQANQNFLALQQELSSTEDRIASARRYYNALVRDLNTKVESIPTNIVAGMAGVKRAEYFETSQAEAQVPTVSFGGQQGGTPSGAPTQPGTPQGASTQPGPVVGSAPVPQGGDANQMVTSGHPDATPTGQQTGQVPPGQPAQQPWNPPQA